MPAQHNALSERPVNAMPAKLRLNPGKYIRTEPIQWSRSRSRQTKQNLSVTCTCILSEAQASVFRFIAKTAHLLMVAFILFPTAVFAQPGTAVWTNRYGDPFPNPFPPGALDRDISTA